jgi:hypothetical protein
MSSGTNTWRMRASSRTRRSAVRCCPVSEKKLLCGKERTGGDLGFRGQAIGSQQLHYLVPHARHWALYPSL